MTTQIAVRLPEEMVSELDKLIATGEATSRASVIEQALRRELRRYLYEREATILANAEPDPEMDAWMSRYSQEPLDLD
jgi:Predicted transcriptional regulators containing the CopG/Arc/MetJ DNA-binding domain and a metal-binding domain